MNKKHWYAIAKMVANATTFLPVTIEDIGRKNVGGEIVHEFMIGTESYQIRKEPVDWREDND